MYNVFDYDQVTGTVTLNTPEILLVREFAALLENGRNKCKQDTKGTKHLRAFRELTYIYLAINWQSPYNDYSEQERHQEALKDAHLTDEEWNDPTFRAACRKYQELQNSNRSIRMLKAAQEMVDKFIDYFELADPMERDEQTGKPIYQVKNMIAEISKLNEVQQSLIDLTNQVKKNLAEASTVRGGAKEGYEFRG